eukprot:gene872-1091_t
MQSNQALGTDMLKSQLLMQQAGLIRRVSLGTFINLPFAYKAIENLVKIIDEEMQNIGGQKLTMPKLLPKDLWQKTGRWESSGDDLFKLKDRKDDDYCLAPTHEEIITDLIANETMPNSMYSLRLYQIGDKYRDEIRPRFGLLRGREFMMKDLYSFDKTVEEAISTYMDCKQAYHNIFDRLEVPYTCVEADSGNIGGALSHEFQVLTDVGEDTLIECTNCGYHANIEKAVGLPMVAQKDNGSIHKTYIRVVTNSPKTGTEHLAIVTTNSQDTVNPYSIKPHFKDISTVTVLTKEQYEKHVQLCQQSKKSITFHNLVDSSSGVNTIEGESKLIHGNFREVKIGDKCIQEKCNGTSTLTSRKGIEVGHIFYLGTKYSETLSARVKNQESKLVPLEMGCYGIGVSRLLATIIESKRDDDGLVWPKEIAPYQLILVPKATEKKPEPLSDALKLYEEIIESIPSLKGKIVVDDRLKLSLGAKLKEATFLGFPYTIIVGGNNNNNNTTTSSEENASKRRLAREESSVVLGEEQVAELKEAFELFDKDRTGYIKKDALKTTLKQFGVFVTQEGLDEMFNEADTTKSGAIGFPEFMSMMSRRMKQTSNEQILLNAFKTFDPENLGYIPSSTLSKVLTTVGDKLSEAELQELLTISENEQKQVKYDLFVNTLFAKK